MENLGFLEQKKKIRSSVTFKNTQQVMTQRYWKWRRDTRQMPNKTLTVRWGKYRTSSYTQPFKYCRKTKLPSSLASKQREQAVLTSALLLLPTIGTWTKHLHLTWDFCYNEHLNCECPNLQVLHLYKPRDFSEGQGLRFGYSSSWEQTNSKVIFAGFVLFVF